MIEQRWIYKNDEKNIFWINFWLTVRKCAPGLVHSENVKLSARKVCDMCICASHTYICESQETSRIQGPNPIFSDIANCAALTPSFQSEINSNTAVTTPSFSVVFNRIRIHLITLTPIKLLNTKAHSPLWLN